MLPRSTRWDIDRNCVGPGRVSHSLLESYPFCHQHQQRFTLAAHSERFLIVGKQNVMVPDNGRPVEVTAGCGGLTRL